MLVLMPVLSFSKATELNAICVILCVKVLPNANICVPSPSISCEISAKDSLNNFFCGFFLLYLGSAMA